MILDQHFGFVAVAYLLSFVTICGLIIWVRADYRRQIRKLADLEARGIVRRSRNNNGTD
ncbi:MAG: heme exporter protein CcmD [Fimbriimonadaceae bacterium]|nr:heme exporter protein CcmD [Alphaproteobacteria bacterium]